jgi:cystine transport system substrate-binding protein
MTRSRWRIIILLFIGIAFWITLPQTIDYARNQARIGRAERAQPFPNGIMRIGINPTNPPFAFYTVDGQPIGFEVDLAQALADALGVQAVFVPVGADSLFDALRTGRVDFLIAGLRPQSLFGHPARATQSYFDAGFMLVNSQGFTSMYDMPNQRLAYAYGGDADQQIHQWQRRIAPFHPMPYETASYALDAVRLGLADAALVESAIVEAYLRNTPDWTPERPFITHIPYVIAVRDDRHSTYQTLTRTLEALFKQGIIETLIERWM